MDPFTIGIIVFVVSWVVLTLLDALVRGVGWIFLQIILLLMRATGR